MVISIWTNSLQSTAIKASNFPDFPQNTFKPCIHKKKIAGVGIQNDRKQFLAQLLLHEEQVPFPITEWLTVVVTVSQVYITKYHGVMFDWLGMAFFVVVGHVLGFLTTSAELHRNSTDPMHTHLWSWRKFLNRTADKATLTHYSTFWAIYTYHVEADTHRLSNYKHRDNQNKHRTNSYKVSASITESVHENRMWSKGQRGNYQYFIRRGNITQVKVNLNNTSKFLCHT